MKDIDVQDKILLATLANVVFDGWTEQAVEQGAIEAGFEPGMAVRAFPNGVSDVLSHFADYINREMSRQLAEIDLEGMHLGKRLETAMRLRLEIEGPFKDAVQKAMSHYALPRNAPEGAKVIWKAVDEMWWACGDTSVDFNFYTKRASLGAVYSATMLYWMSDSSEGSEETLTFYRNRLSDTIKAIKVRKDIQGKVEEAVKKVFCLRPKTGLMR